MFNINIAFILFEYDRIRRTLFDGTNSFGSMEVRAFWVNVKSECFCLYVAGFMYGIKKCCFSSE